VGAVQFSTLDLNFRSLVPSSMEGRCPELLRTIRISSILSPDNYRTWSTARKTFELQCI